jgi:hypothetical protein
MIQNINTTSLSLQDYSDKDKNLIQSVSLIKQFGDMDDYVEAHLYSPENAYITSNYNITSYYLENLQSSNLSSNIIFNPSQDIKDLGFNKGDIKITYNLLKFLLSSNYNNNFYIKTISSDRTELEIASLNIPNLKSLYDDYINSITNSTYYRDFKLNFGSNKLIIGVNMLYNDVNSSLYIKLYEPLPSTYSLKDTLWLVEEMSDPIGYEVTFENASNIVNEIIYLKGANFNLETNNHINNETSYLNFNDIFSSPITSSLQQVKSILDEKGIDINVDYTDFSNFSHFGSVYERISNFKYKLGLIENYNYQISLLNTTTSSSFQVSSSQAILTDKVNEIIKKFDGYDYYLYYESSSYSWPKSNSKQPFVQRSVTSSIANTWMTSSLRSASLYDENNPDNLIYTIPENIRNDSQNIQYEVFLNMIGQYFDNIWIYEKSITDLYNNDNNINLGTSKDIILDALKSLGAKTYTSQNNNTDIFNYLLGTNTAGGYSYPTSSVETLITASQYINVKDNSKEIYKRIYHNLPLLYKTKGTSRGIRALIACYGIPDTILNINEFGGTYNTDSFEEDKYRFSYALKLESDDTFNLPFETSQKLGDIYSAPIPPSSFEYRFKLNPPDGTISRSLFFKEYNTLGDHPTEYSRPFGAYTIYNGVTGSIYHVSSSGTTKQSKSYADGKIQFYFAGPTGPIVFPEISLPLYNNDWWHVMFSVSSSTDDNTIPNKYTAYVQNKTYLGDNKYEIGYVASASLSVNSSISSNYYVTNSMWLGIDATMNLKGIEFLDRWFNTTILDFSGSVQEFRYWNIPLTKEAFDKHTLNSLSIEGNNPSSSYDDLMFRAPLGNDLKTYNSGDYAKSIHPYITGSMYVTESFSYYTGATSSLYAFNGDISNFYPLVQTDTVNSSNTGYNKIVTDKIKILEENNISGSTLSPFISIQKDQNIKTFNSNDLEVVFSPQDQINNDIKYSLGNFNIDEFIGDPREKSNYTYSSLKSLKLNYFKKYISKYGYFGFINLVKYFDNSLFKSIKDYVPAKARVSTGIMIKPHILERNKIPTYDPTVLSLQYSQSIDMSSISSDNGGILVLSGSYTQNIHTPAGNVLLTLDSGKGFYQGELENSTIKPTNINTSLGYFKSNIDNTTHNISWLTNYTINFNFKSDKKYYLSFDVVGTATTFGGSAILTDETFNTYYYYNTSVLPGETVHVECLEVAYPLSPRLVFSVYDYLQTSDINNLTIYEAIEGFNPILNNVYEDRKSKIFNQVDNETLGLQTSYGYKATTQDSNYTLARYINPRYLGSKNDKRDEYVDYFTFFEWIGNAQPEKPGYGNVRLRCAIDKDGNQIALGNNKENFLIESIYKQNTSASLYFISQSIQKTIYSSSIYDAACLYQYVVYKSGSSDPNSAVAYWGRSGQVMDGYATAGTEMYTDSTGYILNTYDHYPYSGTGNILYPMLTSSMQNLGDIGWVSSSNVSKYDSLAIWDTWNNDNSKNVGNIVQYKNTLFPIQNYYYIRLSTGSLFNYDKKLYFETLILSTSIDDIRSDDGTLSSGSLYIQDANTIYKSGDYKQEWMIYRRIIRDDFVVIKDLPNIQSQGFLVPYNYNPNLNFYEIAKKAGLI